MPGQSTTTLSIASVLTHILGESDVSTVRQTIADLAAQLAARPEFLALNDALEARLVAAESDIETLEDATAYASILKATWSELSATSGTSDGQRAEVDDGDAGTHGAATGTGYDGSTVDNAGVYSWNAAWSRWVRIGDTGTAAFLAALDLKAPIENAALTGTPTAPTAAPGTDTTQIATTAFAQALATALVGGAPGDLDTLDKIAEAIGDDADFATTMANALALKAPLASPALTGTPTAPTAAPDTDSTQIATAAFVMRALLKANRLPLGLPFALADEDGQVPFRIEDDGSVTFGNFGFLTDQKVLGAEFAIEDDAGQIALAILAAGAVAIGRAEFWSMPPLGPALIVEGEDGQAPLVVDLDGRTDLLTSGNGDNSETNPRAVLRPDQATRSTPDIVGLNHFLMSGQSLSVAGNTAYSDAQVDSNDVTFSGGIDISTAYTGNTLVPHPTIGDAQIARCAISQLKHLIQTDPDNTSYKMLTSAHGQSGQAIANLDKGSSAFANGMHQVEEGARLADAASLIHQVQALMWVQGHADAATALATYKSTLRQMLDDYHADIEEITGQSWQFPLVAYQGSNEQTNVGGSSEYEPVVARAIYEMSAEHADIIAAVPSYHVIYSDGTHMTGDSYQQIGQHIGRVLYAVLIRGEEWTGLRPREVRAYRSDEVLVRFHVPVAPIVFDTDAVDDPGDYGFEVRDDDGTPAINSVSIVSSDTVRIKLDRDLAANPTLAYAWYTNAGTDAGPSTGPRGCLFDSDTTEAYQRGNSLANPCLRFKEAIS